MSDTVPGGYNGRILRVDLTTRKHTVETIDESFCRKYIGGTGFIAYYLVNEVHPEVDALSPENKLIFAGGPLTGIALAGAARHAVGAKSPLTGGIAKSEAGEAWGPQFKRAGFDALILEGRATEPVYLWVHDGEVEIRKAAHLWGKETRETQETIRSELGDERIRVAMIGPGGENLVKFACIMHGLYDAAGRGGLGAVMGSKNLKAVAVRGNTMPPVRDPEGVKKLAAWMRENVDLMKGFRDFGTGGAMERFEEAGNVPIRNFQGAPFPQVSNISPKTMKDTISVGMEGCFACPIRCKKEVQMSEPYPVDRAYGGPEYETIGAIGSCCGVDDLAAVAYGSALCNAYSLDTISTGVTISFAMECYEKGLLTPADTGGVELAFGNAGAMIRAIELIAKREGIGDLLAEGSAGAARKIGRGAEAYAMHVKGLEFPMHEPRLSTGLALGYMVNPHGADHMDNMVDVLLSGFGEQPAMSLSDAVPLGLERTSLEDIGPRKTAFFKVFQGKRIICDSLALCHFFPYSLTQIAGVLSSVTGWETSELEQIRISERILALCRLFNIKAGLSVGDDVLPKRFFETAADGPLADRSLDPEAMERALKYYYRLMGWDEHGVPTPEKLEELGIEQYR